MVPTESDDNLRLEIGHVLFIDIVGYSKLLIEEQKERLNQLTEIVLATTPVREAVDEQLVRLSTGDAALKKLIDENADDGGSQIAAVYALRKEPDKIFEWLEHAWAAHDPGVVDLLFNPFLLAYKDDPRFIAFAKKIGVMPK